MKLRVEPFVQGFMVSIKPTLTSLDRELLKAFFSSYRPASIAVQDESHPAKAAHYFRLRAAHYNVLLPTWALSQRQPDKPERYRIFSTADHSVIYDSKEKIIYDPTCEILHATPEYKLLAVRTTWQEESQSLLSDELASGSLKVFSLAERIESMPLVYNAFVTIWSRHRLKSSLPKFRPGLSLQDRAAAEKLQAKKDWELTEAVLEELMTRRQKTVATRARARG